MKSVFAYLWGYVSLNKALHEQLGIETGYKVLQKNKTKQKNDEESAIRFSQRQQHKPPPTERNYLQP